MFWLRNKKIFFWYALLTKVLYILSRNGPMYIIYDGVKGYIFKKKNNLSLKINFELANSANPNEMPHYAAYHLSIHCLAKYIFRGFQSTKKLGSKLLGSACS